MILTKLEDLGTLGENSDYANFTAQLLIRKLQSHSNAT